MRLQDVILSLPRLMDGAWRDVFADGGAVTAGDGMRVHAGAGATVTLPLRDVDGSAPADLSRVQALGPNPAAGVWIYAASNGAWRRADVVHATFYGGRPYRLRKGQRLVSSLFDMVPERHPEHFFLPGLRSPSVKLTMCSLSSRP